MRISLLFVETRIFLHESPDFLDQGLAGLKIPDRLTIELVQSILKHKKLLRIYQKDLNINLQIYKKTF